jgi:predicted negative regulator of RcsB-dependent stress response
MQTQDAPTEFLIKFWPWFEANRNRIIGFAVAVVVIVLAVYFYSTEQAQKAVDAGRAYTQLQLNQPPNPTVQQVADEFQQLANKYPGTIAGQRALAQAASVLFSAGRYADAQADFQKLAAINAAGPLAASAQLGVGACLEAQNQLDAAATAYHAVLSGFPNSAETLPAKFSLGRVLEAQNKPSEAASYYGEVAHSPLGGSLAQEAAERLAHIQAAAKPASKP